MYKRYVPNKQEPISHGMDMLWKFSLGTDLI